MLSGYPGYGSGFMQPGAGQPYAVGGMYGNGGYGYDGMPGMYPNTGYMQSQDYSPTYGHTGAHTSAYPAASTASHLDYSNYATPANHVSDTTPVEIVHEPQKKSYNPNAEPSRSALKSPSPVPSPRKDGRTPSPPLKELPAPAHIDAVTPQPLPEPRPTPQPKQQPKQQSGDHPRPVMVDAATGITVDSGTTTDDLDDLPLSALPVKQKQPSATPAATANGLKSALRQMPEWRPEYSSSAKDRVPPPVPPPPQPTRSAPSQPPAIAVDSRCHPAQERQYHASPPQPQAPSPNARLSNERVTSRMDHASNPLRSTCPLPSTTVTTDAATGEEESDDEYDSTDVLGQLRQSLKLSTADFNRAVASRMHKKLVEQQQHHLQHLEQHQQQPQQRSPPKRAAAAAKQNQNNRSAFMV